MTESHDEPLKENFQLELMVFASSKFGKFNLRLKEIPPSGPLFFLKMVKSTGLLIFLVLLDPLNPILKKNGWLP